MDSALLTRALAQRILISVLDRGNLLDDAFARVVDASDLEPRDRAFVRALVTVTLRRLGQLDAAIDQCLNRPLKGSAARIRHLLRLGAAQLLFLDTPPHAAVATAVELAGRERSPALRSLKGLVNAVLRRIGREGADMLATQDAARLNLPDWLWQSWAGRFGPEVASAMAEAHLHEPPLDLTLHPRADRAALVQAFEDRKIDVTTSPTGGLRLDARGRVNDLPGYGDGLWWVQDAAAALPVQLLAPRAGEMAGERVLDLCAAPGGKTAQIAATGAEAIAVDISATRLARMRENLDRLKLNATLVAADAGAVPFDAPVDRVLLDAPCMATGTLRRHPDGKWIKKPEDVAAMADVQARLLAAAIDYLKPGGTLVYCVCSLEAAEGPDQISRLLASGAPVERDAITLEDVAGLDPAVLVDGDVQTLPSHDMDGFFISRFRRL